METSVVENFSKPKWSEEQRELISRLDQEGLSPAEIAEHFPQRTPKAVNMQLYKLRKERKNGAHADNKNGYRRGNMANAWKLDELQLILLKHSEGLSTQEIHELLPHRTATAITVKLSRLNRLRSGDTDVKTFMGKNPPQEVELQAIKSDEGYSPKALTEQRHGSTPKVEPEFTFKSDPEATVKSQEEGGEAEAETEPIPKNQRRRWDKGEHIKLIENWDLPDEELAEMFGRSVMSINSQRWRMESRKGDLRELFDEHYTPQPRMDKQKLLDALEGAGEEVGEKMGDSESKGFIMPKVTEDEYRSALHELMLRGRELNAENIRMHREMASMKKTSSSVTLKFLWGLFTWERKSESNG